MELSTPVGGKHCGRCQRTKPLEQFHRNQYWCKNCQRIHRMIRRQRPDVQAKEAAYRRQPHVKAAKAASDARRYEKSRAATKRYRQTPRGRLLHARWAARKRLSLATTDERRAALDRLCALYDAEIARLDRDLNGGETRPYREKWTA